MRLDFAIVGEPKSGTTSLYTYLAGHPRIAMSSRKEPAFWSSDLARLRRVTDPQEYAALWQGAPADALRGEGSTNYLRSEVAVPAILRAHPGARLIAMVRNPVDMAAAWHSEMFKNLQEDAPDLETAWRLLDRRRRGEAIPRLCKGPARILYDSVCAIGDHLASFVAVVPPEQRMIILFDDLSRDAGDVYRRTLEFLGLEDDGRRDFETVGSNRRLRSRRLAELHRSMPRRLGPLYGPARKVARSMGLSPSAVMSRVNYEDRPRRPLRPGFRAELVEAFAPQVAKTAALLERDLSHWR